MEQQLNEEASIYPDYKEVTIPANIAPLNISLINLNDAQLILEGESGESFQIADKADRMQTGRGQMECSYTFLYFRCSRAY